LKKIRWAAFSGTALLLAVLTSSGLCRRGLVDATFVSSGVAPRTFPRLEMGFSSSGLAPTAEDVAHRRETSRTAGACGFVMALAVGVGFLANAAASRAAKLRRRAIADRPDSLAGQQRLQRENSSERSVSVAATAVEEVQLVTDVSPDAGPAGTYQVGIDFKGWLQSCAEELDVHNLRVEGSLPPWLRGSLLHAGPAKFEFGDDEFVDWIDGQAMLYRIQILPDGSCTYRNRWLDTWNHRSHREAGKIAVRETCSRPSISNFFDRLKAMASPPNNENGNLHISQVCGNARCVSMSVGSSMLEFRLADLSTLGKLPFNDELTEGGPLIFHAEPHVDPTTGEWYTCAIQLKVDLENFGMKPEYVVFSIEPTESQQAGAEVKRRLITRIETEYPSPVHTIGLTPQFIVMIQIPYPLNWDGMLRAEGNWLMTGHYEGNLNDYNTWQPERPTIIHLIDRVTGEHTEVFETDPFFFFHIVNSFEAKEGCSEVVYVDVVCYNEPPVGFPLEQARSGDVEDWRGGGGEVRRLRLDRSTGECTMTGWPDNCFDEPKVNPKVDGVQHRYSYGVIDDHGMLRITKQDHETHDVVKWKEQDVSRELPWQPVFVPEPYNSKEDAGVVMSFVRDQPTGDSFCVVIDAETFEEQARIHFPKGHHVPLHGHGAWMQGQFQ